MISGLGSQEIHLRDYLYVLRKRRLAVFITIIAVVCAGIYLTYREKVIFKATATVLIERENPNVVDFKEVMAFDTSTTDYYQTQYQILESHSLIERVIEKEKLYNDPYLLAIQKGGSVKRFLKKFNIQNIWLDQFLREPSLADIFIKFLLRIEPVRNSRLVGISILYPDPERAVKISNTLVDQFIHQNLQKRFMISQQATGLLSEQLDELKEKVVSAERELQDYKEKHGLINIPSMHEKDKLIQDAKLELVKLEAEEAMLSRRYLPAHPKRIHIASQIQVMRDNVTKEEAQNMDLSRIALEYTQLEREAASSRQIYETLLARFQEMHSEANTQASNIMVVDRSRVPTRPYKPRPFLNLLISIFIGILSGLGLAFFLEYLDSTVRVPDDIEKGLQLELFGIIPYAPKDKKGALGGEIFFSPDKPSQAAESLRALRTALMFRLRHTQGCRTILVSSPNPGEGKSTVILNLAAAFRQNNLKVLLIDADLRKPKLHRRLGIMRGKGLTDLMEGELQPRDAIYENVQDLGFDFLGCGSPSHHATELLGSDRMIKFLEWARTEYDIVLIDSPPFLAVADVAVLSEFSNALVIVARYHQTERRHLRDLKKRFTGTAAEKVLGVVINQVSVREKDYYYHQYYYYGYGDAKPKR